MITKRTVYLIILSFVSCFGTTYLAPDLTEGRVLRRSSRTQAVRQNSSAPLRRSRLVRLEITRRESFADGMSFGSTGPYEKIVGKAYLQADPNDPQDSIIQDLDLAPRNAAGMVEYQGDFYILKPLDMNKSNGTLFYEVPAAGGNKTALRNFNWAAANNDPSTATHAGDGFLMNRGYTIAWSGMNGTQAPGNNAVTLSVPFATQGGAPITGVVSRDFFVSARTNTQSVGEYPSASLDNSTASLTFRMREADPRVAVPNDQWSFANCSAVPFPGAPSTTQICLRDGFDPNFLYELIYPVKDPKVLGLGLAAVRDFVTFLRYGTGDDQGTPNPLTGAIRDTIVYTVGSPATPYIRSFLDLGFNQDASGRRVFDGVITFKEEGRSSLNVRFGRPAGIVIAQHENHLVPRYESPLTWSTENDPVVGYAGGLLERCQQTGTCPKIIQLVASYSYWTAHGSRHTTDAFGRRDLQIPDNVRFYLLSSIAGAIQMSATAVPTLGDCQQLQNILNADNEALRPLLSALQRWITEGVEPEPNQIPTLRDGTLVRPDKASIGWPDIPGVKYTGIVSERLILDFGSRFNLRNLSGIITEHPPKVVAGPSYVQLVPKVDADGNEIAGIRMPVIQAPLGTYTGWRLRRAGFAEDDMCAGSGSFIPFAKTQAERLAKGDPRLSLEERYGTHDGYAAAVRAAAERLVARGFLLQEDAQRLIELAAASDILR